MHIDGIELYLVENAFYKPWRTAYGSDPGNSVVIARMVSGKHDGWSKSSPLPDPNYSYEYGHGAFEVCKRLLAPLVLGKDVSSASINYPVTITQRTLTMTPDKMLELATESGTPVEPDVEKMMQKVTLSAVFGSCSKG